MRDEKCCLSYWFPMIEKIVPVPKTTIIRCDRAVTEGDNGGVKIDPDLIANVTAAADAIGYACFLRSGQTSGKHGWKDTCFVDSAAVIKDRIYGIWEYSECADLMGLPTHVWAVRELLKTESPFTAFSGFPVTKERRYFIKDGKIVGHTPYWPPDAIEDHTSFKGWRSELIKLNAESSAEVAELRKLTMKVARVMEGAWSVDWLWTTDRGWVCIDMAEAHKSFCWREHPNAPKCEFTGARI